MSNATEWELLTGLLPEQAAPVRALGVPVPLSAGHVLFELGAAADTLYVVDRGRIVLTLPLRIAGHEQHVVVEERLAGQALGWSALIPPHRFTLKATASLDSIVTAFPRGALLDHFAAHPEVGYAVMRNVAAVTGHRLQVFEAMWLREMQRAVSLNLT